MSSRAKTTSAVPRSRLQERGASENVDRQGFAVGRDETPLYYRVRGPAHASAIVFCDGIGCDGYVWKYLERELSPNHRVVHWHYRGHGRTPPPRDRRHIDIVDLADDLVAVLDAAVDGGARAVLAGHSMGVQVCLEAYRRHPERVSGLVLLCGSYGTPLRTFKGKRTLEQVLPYVKFAVNRIPNVVANVWARVIPTELAYQIATRFEINGELIRREDFFPYLEHMARVDVRLFLDMLAAAGRHSARELLSRIDVPTLIISGDRDGFTPAALSQEMHKLIRDSELFVVAGGSHTAPIERPAEVTARIADFLRKQF
jgi:pimeloyl-ACP methyl ester carboxylesterase